MKLIVRGALVAAMGLACAASANAATISLQVDGSKSSGKTLKTPTGGTAFEAPFTLLKFVSQVTNDAGGPVTPPSGQPVTVDLIGRSADGEFVLNTQHIYTYNAGQPVEFPLQAVNQNTMYYARVNANPAAGIAAPATSGQFAAPSYLRNYPSAYHSNYTRTVTFSGFYSRVDGLPARAAVRTLIQRRSGKTWKTIRTLTPNATNQWRTRVPTGTLPAVFRVRTVASTSTASTAPRPWRPRPAGPWRSASADPRRMR